MKICYLANGGNVHVLRRVDYLIKKGYEIHIISEHPCPVPGVIQHNPLPGKSLPLLLYLKRLYNIILFLKKIKPDIIHVSFIAPEIVPAVFFTRRPVLLTAWGSDILHPRTKFLKKLLSKIITIYAINRADYITAVSVDLHDRIERLNFLKRPNIVMRFGVDSVLFHPGENRTDLRKKYGFSRHDFILFSPRRTRPLYNIDVIIKAFENARRHSGKSLKLIIKGKEQDDGESIKFYFEITNLIKRLNLEDAIIEKVHLTDEEMAQLYTIADCVISVPSSDGMPLTVLEAMSCGTAIISSDLPSLHEVISPGKNGILVPVRDEEALSDAMSRLHDNQTFRANLSMTNRDFIIREADFTREMNGLEEIYRSLIPN